MNRTETTPNPQELVELAEKKAGVQATGQIIEKHLSLIMDVRQRFPLDDVDLLAGNIAKISDVPQAVVDDIGKLKAKIRIVIEEVALRIENHKYKSVEEAVESMNLSQNERTRVSALVRANKNVNVSCQSLKIAIEFFSEMNKLIIKKIEEVRDAKVERNLLLGNAILVHELTDFLAGYIESFGIQGVAEIEKFHNDTRQKIAQLRSERDKLESAANQNNIEKGIREQILGDIKTRDGVIEELEKEWDEVVTTIKQLQNEVGAVSGKLPTLRLIKDNAAHQIKFLETISVIGIVKRNLQLVEASALNLEHIKLVDLSVDKVRRLLGIK